MQKAMKWLTEHEVEFDFHDYKEKGIDKKTISNWLRHLPLEKLLNRQSTTYRALSDNEKADADDKSKAIALMMKYHSLIKRPVWDIGNGQFFLGWKENELSSLLLGK